LKKGISSDLFNKFDRGFRKIRSIKTTPTLKKEIRAKALNNSGDLFSSVFLKDLFSRDKGRKDWINPLIQKEHKSADRKRKISYEPILPVDWLLFTKMILIRKKDPTLRSWKA
jgi:hypothetical protein